MVGDQQAGDRGQESISEVCYCHFVGHNQLYLPPEIATTKVPFTGFTKNSFLELNLCSEVIWLICLLLH